MSVELILLSRVSYRDDEITGPRLRDLVALLAADLRAGCGTARLVEELWPDEQPENPTKALQILVSRVRGQLGAEVVARTATGYRLALEPEQVDSSALLVRAAAAAQHARTGEHAAALAEAEAGLALWDGDGVDGHDAVAALRAERAVTRRSLERARALALARLGRHGEAVDVLAGLAVERPHDEEVLLELLRAEAATAGPSTALTRYETYRRSLRDELGTEPGAAVRELHQQLLQGEPVRHGVPHEPNALLGRDADVAAVSALVRTARVTTVVGPGGLGKTRLAQAVGLAAEQRAVYLVGLAGVGADEDVAGEVASVVGAGEGRIVDALGAGALLILDNCEHVLRGAADLVRELVSASKDLRVLTTSRAPLGLSSESVYPLPELDVDTSVALFEQRARAARPGVELPADVVRELCARLDGLPLAVELAAARVRVLSVREIADRLADRFALLRGGSRDAPARHHTLRAVVEWSWNLLDAAGREAMAALAVFPGGFTAEAAGWLVDGDVLDVLAGLVDQSLVKVDETPAGTRFRMLETVREFARGDGPVERFLAWAKDFGARHHDAVLGPDAYTAAPMVRAEQDNLLHAMRLDPHPALAAPLLSLAVVESNYTRLTSLVDEYEPVLVAAEPTEPARTALALSALYKHLAAGLLPSRAMEALRGLPDGPPNSIARVLATVLAASPEQLVALCDSEHRLLASSANGFTSYLHEQAGDLAGALAAAQRSVAAISEAEFPWTWAQSHCRVGELALRAEEAQQAREHLLSALPVMERLGATADAAGIRWWLVLASLQAGMIDDAEHWLAQVAPSGDSGIPSYDQAVRAEVLLARGETDAGLALWRRVVDDVSCVSDYLPGDDPLGSDLWAVEARCVAVVAHAQHGALDRLGDVSRRLAGHLSALLGASTAQPPPFLVELPIWGVMLAAVGMADIASGRASGVRLIALADACGFLRNFQPTMRSERLRQAARDADGPAYADAVSEYAGLGRDELRLAGVAALSARG